MYTRAPRSEQHCRAVYVSNREDNPCRHCGGKRSEGRSLATGDELPQHTTPKHKKKPKQTDCGMTTQIKILAKIHKDAQAHDKMTQEY